MVSSPWVNSCVIEAISMWLYSVPGVTDLSRSSIAALRDMLINEAYTSSELRNKIICNDSMLSGMDLQEIAERLQVSFVILDKKESCIELLKISPTLLFSFVCYPPSEQEFLLRKRGSVITPAYGTVYLWVDSVKQHCQLLIDDNQLSSFQTSSKEERMSAARISLNPIKPGSLLCASSSYTDTYPILGSSNGSTVRIQ